MKSLFMSLLVFALIPGGAAFADIQWTIQGGDIKIKRPNGTETKLIDDQVYQQPPQIQKGACAENGAPICVGYVLVKEGDTPPRVGPSACKAIKKGDKWICPKAKVCYDDEDVSIATLQQMPAAAPSGGTAAPAGAPQNPGSPEGQREGIGGR